MLKVYGPNTRNECTMMMTKCKKHDALFVKLLALDIVQQSNSHGGASLEGNSGCLFLVKNVLLPSNYA